MQLISQDTIIVYFNCRYLCIFPERTTLAFPELALNFPNSCHIRLVKVQKRLLRYVRYIVKSSIKRHQIFKINIRIVLCHFLTRVDWLRADFNFWECESTIIVVVLLMGNYPCAFVSRIELHKRDLRFEKRFKIDI